MTATAMIIRRMNFPYPEGLRGWWNSSRPEFSHMVNSGSLAMPFLEPYLIDVMKQARTRITDPRLQHDVDQYIAQESTHFRQHQQFNRRLADMGYRAVAEHEARLKADYEALGKTRSLTFNIAYAEGFEAMGLCVGHMLVEDRAYLFGDADPAVSSLILWHFVEEIEHKTVTYDVFKALDGRYVWRIYGLLYATTHIFFRAWQGYRALLIEDGRWFNIRNRLVVYGLLARMFSRLVPKLLRILKPGYDPRQVKDPSWVTAWWRMHQEGRSGLGALDTTRLNEAEPVTAKAP